MNKTTMTTTAAPVDQTDAVALDAIETALLTALIHERSDFGIGLAGA